MYDRLSESTQKRVDEQLDYWVGTLHARLIERALDFSDHEAVLYHLRNAEAEQSIQEDNVVIRNSYGDAVMIDRDEDTIDWSTTNAPF